MRLELLPGRLRYDPEKNPRGQGTCVVRLSQTGQLLPELFHGQGGSGRQGAYELVDDGRRGDQQMASGRDIREGSFQEDCVWGRGLEEFFRPRGTTAFHGQTVTSGKSSGKGWAGSEWRPGAV